MNGGEIIRRLRRHWQTERRITRLATGIGVGLLLAAMAKGLAGWQGGWLLLPALVALAPALYWSLRQKTSLREVTDHLDRACPLLEDSSSLLLEQNDSGSLLFRLQQQKAGTALQQIEWPKPYRENLLLTVSSAALAFCLLLAVPAKQLAGEGDNVVTVPGTGSATPLPLQIAGVRVLIQAPAYTGLPAIVQTQLPVQTVQGAAIQWTLQTNKPAQKTQLLFNDSSVLVLHPADSSFTQWRGEKKVEKPGFYRVDTDGLPSDFYTIEVKPDLPPVVNIISPEGQTNIEAGMPFRVAVRALLNDDYGLVSARLAATIASGSGEAVKFRNESIDFSGIVRKQERVSWNHLLDLNQWQLKGGDELYFYIEATDGRGQSARSDVCIVRLPDTTELLSLDGLLSAMDIKPEFFRSQRQIIIETEQLIRDRNTMSVEAFNAKSNELGSEQKLLRLRYGKFLGEEDETQIGGHHDHGHDDDHDQDDDEAAHNDAADFGNAEKILSEVTHQHDIAEDATFFDAETKKQLKATLTEMWNAELKLRVYQPAQALPYEYKALRLLKDLQQQSRVYVAKTGVKTTPLDLTKRGSGDQDKIIAPRLSYRQTTATTAEQEIAAGLISLRSIADGGPGDLGNLQKAAVRLSAAAAGKPASLLPRYQALLRVMDALGKQAHAVPADLEAASNGLAELLPPAPGLPSPALSPAATPLSKEYLKKLSTIAY